MYIRYHVAFRYFMLFVPMKTKKMYDSIATDKLVMDIRYDAMHAFQIFSVQIFGRGRECLPSLPLPLPFSPSHKQNGSYPGWATRTGLCVVFRFTIPDPPATRPLPFAFPFRGAVNIGAGPAVCQS
jgi:hypothetical protein